MATLTSSLLEALEPETGAEMRSVPDLEQRLDELVEACRRTWPDIELDPGHFIYYLGCRLQLELPAAERLEQVHAAELYLACACVDGSPEAISLFERDYGGVIRRAVDRLTLPAALREEATASLRAQILVGSGDGPPLLSRYSGHGKLAGWLRITSVRAALKLADSALREVPVEDDLLAALAEQPPMAGAGAVVPQQVDPELRYLKELLAGEVGAAIRQAARELPARERNLLQLHYLEQLSIDDLGGLYKVHRATAARWLVRARQELLAQVRRALQGRLGIRRSEFDSIMELVRSRFDMTLTTLFASKSKPS